MKKTAIIFLITLASCTDKNIQHFISSNHTYCVADSVKIQSGIDSAWMSGYTKGIEHADSIFISKRSEIPQKFWYEAYSITEAASCHLTSYRHYAIGDTTDANGGIIIVKSKPHRLK